MTIGSDSGWLMLAGMMARPAATSSRTTSAGTLAHGHELHLRGDLAAPGVVQLGDRRTRRPQRPTTAEGKASGPARPAHRGPAVVASVDGPSVVLLDVTSPGIHARRKGGRPTVGTEPGPDVS